MRRTLILRPALALAIAASACKSEPGEVRMRMVWNDPPPTERGLWVLASVEERPGDIETRAAHPLVTAPAVEYVPPAGATIELDGIPNGDDRVFVVEIRDKPTTGSDSRVVYRGLSAKFSLSAGASLDVPVGLELERAPEIPAQVSVVEANARRLVNSDTVTVRVVATQAKTIEIARDPDFTLGKRSFEAAEHTVSSSVSTGRSQLYLVSYDLDADLAPCDAPGCHDGPRTLFLKVIDALGYESPVSSLAIFLDSKLPRLLSVTFSPILARPGITAYLTIEADEALGEPPRFLWEGARDPGFGEPEQFGLRHVFRLPIDAVEAGAYRLASVVLTDAAGNVHTATAAASGGLPATLTVLRGGPKVTITSLSADRVGSSGTLELSFELDQPVDPSRLEVTLGGRPMEPCVPQELRRRCHVITGDEIPDGTTETETLLIRASDEAGNVGSAEAAVVFDFQAPSLVAGSTGVQIDATATSAINDVGAMQAGATAHVGFTLDEETEPLEVFAIPPLSLAPESDLETSHVYRYTAGAGDADGSYEVWVVARDVVGNAAPPLLVATLLIDNAAPPPPDPDAVDRIVFVRDSLRGEFSLRGAAGAVEPSASVLALDENGLTLGRATADAEGGFPELVLDPVDRSVVLVAAVDAAGNASTRIGVKDVVWTPVTSSELENPGSSWRWRHLAGEETFLARQNHALVRDPATGTLLMFGGGVESTLPPSGGFWTNATFYDAALEAWNGSAWEEHLWLPGAGPERRLGAAVAFDPGRQRLVVHGGIGIVDWSERGRPSSYDYGTLPDVSWEWNGGSWDRSTGLSEDGPAGQVAWYDPDRRAVLEFGGYQRTLYESSMAGNPMIWRDILLGDTVYSCAGGYCDPLPFTGPAARAAAQVVYDPIRHEAVLFGGKDYYADEYFGGSHFDTGPILNETALGDTWVLRADGWTSVPTPSGGASPAPRWNHAMAYDPARARTVLFGGWTSNGVASGETWEWDGARWSLSPSTLGGPPPAAGAAMVYDPSRGGLLLTSTGGTWVRSGSRWLADTRSSPQPGDALDAPSAPRAFASIASDWPRGQVVLFGGTTAASGGAEAVLGSTLLWDGGRWLVPAGSCSSAPAARMDQATAFSPELGQVMLAGGQGGGSVWGSGAAGISLDTWVWDGACWSARGSAAGARYGHAIARAPAGAGLVLFGGFAGSTAASTTLALSNDTLAWNESALAWRSVTISGPAPAPRARHGMATDVASSKLVLFGGCDAAGHGLADTWEFDGARWTPVTPAGEVPPARCGHAMVYDPVRGRVIMAGGRSQDGPLASSATSLADVWAWSSADQRWTRLPALDEARAGLSVALDATREQLIAVGGRALVAPLPGLDVFSLDRATRPRRVLAADLGDAEALGSEVVGIALVAQAGGSGASDTAGPVGQLVALTGAEVAVWDAPCGAWLREAELGAASSAPAPLSLAAPSSVDARRWVSADGRVAIAAWPSGGYGSGDVSPEIAFAGELEIRYRRGGGRSEGSERATVTCDPRSEPSLRSARLEREPNDVLAEANDAAFFPGGAATLSGRLSTSGDLDLWAFDLPEGATLVARTYGSIDDPTTPCSGELDTSLTLLGASGSTIVTGTDPAGSACAVIDGRSSSSGGARALHAGRYYLRVRQTAGATSPPPYFLDVSVE